MTKQVNEAEKAELLRHIEFAGDEKRLPLLIKHGFKDEVLAELEELIDNNPTHWQDPSRCSGLLIATTEDREGLSRSSDKEYKHGPVIQIRGAGSLTVQGLREFFDWDDDELSTFLRRVFASTLKLDPRINLWHGPLGRRMCSWEISATRKAMDLYLPEGNELRDAVDLWTLRANFRQEYHPVINSNSKTLLKLTGRTLREKDHSVRINDPDYVRLQMLRWTDATNLVVERMIELGLSEKDALEDLIVAVEGNPSIHLCITAAVLQANAFHGLRFEESDRGNYWRKEGRDRLGAACQSIINKSMAACLMDGHYSPPVYNTLFRLSGYKPTFDKGKWHEGITEHLANGRVAAAYQLIKLFDRHFGYSLTKTERSGIRDRKVVDVASKIPFALDRAIEAKRFGVAAALVNQFGAEACFNPEVLKPKARAEAKEQGKRVHKHILEELNGERQTQIREIHAIAAAVGQTPRLNLNPLF